MSNPITPPPTAWQLERAVSTWQQLQQAEAGDQFIDTDEALVDVTRFGDQDAMLSDPHVLLERLIDAAIWADRRVEEAAEIKRRIDARRARYQARSDHYRGQIKQLLEVLGQRAWEGSDGTASIRKGRPSVVITDLDRLEAAHPDLVKVEKTAKKLEIAPLLKEGKLINGAEMSNPEPTLTIIPF